MDLTSSPQMKQLLNVRPVQDIPIQSGRQEGPILKVGINTALLLLYCIHR